MLASEVDIALLVRHAKSGNTDAFAALVENYEHEIYSYLLRQLGDPDEANDFVQQVFFKAWTNLATLKDAACFKAWLFAIARHLLLDSWRVKKAHQKIWVKFTISNADEEIYEIEECIVKAELISQVLAALSPKLRQCLILRLAGWADYEIAKKVGISEASVGTYVSTARKQFRELYRLLDEE